MNTIYGPNHVKLAVYDMNPTGKETIILIHGWPFSSKIFEYPQHQLTEENYRVILIDLRGFGASDAPAGPYTYDQLAEDIYYIVRVMKLNHFVLGGFSMGGGVALRYMTRFKGFGVSKLALIAAAAPYFIKKPGQAHGIPRESADKLFDLALTDRPELCRCMSSMLCSASHSTSYIQAFEWIALSANGHATIKTGEAMKEENVSEDMVQLQVPTGIFHGQRDQFIPYQLALVQNEMITNSRLYPFPDSGHGIFCDKPELFHSSFMEFLLDTF